MWFNMYNQIDFIYKQLIFNILKPIWNAETVFGDLEIDFWYVCYIRCTQRPALLHRAVCASSFDNAPAPLAPDRLHSSHRSRLGAPRARTNLLVRRQFVTRSGKGAALLLSFELLSIITKHNRFYSNRDPKIFNQNEFLLNYVLWNHVQSKNCYAVR